MEKKDFQNIIITEESIIGYILGSNRVLFVKTGQSGTIYGYENKYLALALEINEKYGFSVFISKTTNDTYDSFQRDIQTLEDTFGTSDFEIYYLGVSKGGLIGIWYGYDEPRISKMISINAPLMINYHGKTLPGVKNLGIDKLTMVYGSLDPSYKYVPFVEKHASVQIIEGADHNLRDYSQEYFKLVQQLMLRVTVQYQMVMASETLEQKSFLLFQK